MIQLGLLCLSLTGSPNDRLQVPNDSMWARQRTDRVIRLMLEGDALRSERDRIVQAPKLMFADSERDRLSLRFTRSYAGFALSSQALRFIRLDVKPMPFTRALGEAQLKARVHRFVVALGYEGLEGSTWKARPRANLSEGYIGVSVAPRRYGLRTQDSFSFEIHAESGAIRYVSFADPLDGPKRWTTLITADQAQANALHFLKSRGESLSGQAVRVIGPIADSFRPLTRPNRAPEPGMRGHHFETVANHPTQIAMKSGHVFAIYRVLIGEPHVQDYYMVHVDAGTGLALNFMKIDKESPGTIEP